MEEKVLAIETQSYESFDSKQMERAAARGDRYQYSGRDLDSETGLQYNRARCHDPRIGRWLAEEPLGSEAGDQNLYPEVISPPTNAANRSGRNQSCTDG